MGPAHVKVVGCKWVFAHKLNEKGEITRYKARLVALGYLQTHGLDYWDTYSPVASMNTIRVFLFVCCKRKLKIRQFDNETVFLNGDFEEEVYMVIPPGVHAASGMVCRLRRSLYGLKQAAAAWFKTIRSVFVEIGFDQCRADPCIFVRTRDGQDPVFIVLYVDDLLIAVSSTTNIDAIRDQLASRFTVKSLGDRYILGIEIHYALEKGELSMKQTQFITRMLERCGQLDACAVRNPLVHGQDLIPDETHKPFNEKTKYRELIGSLLYVANSTRPDISVAVSILSQYLDCPRKMHWRAAIRVLRYLKGTSRLGIQFKSKNTDTSMSIAAFSDSKWGGDKQSRRSTSGVLVQLAGGPAVYNSKRQATVALSSAEAEYMALALTTQEVIWIRFLLGEMGERVDAATTIHLDNKSAISIATNHGYTPRAKHIDLRAHFVRDHVAKGRIKLKRVALEDQLADYLTKALPTPQFTHLRGLSAIIEAAS